eukprot:TRINITY_DN953_c0_g1_i1.p1 TRINITY_DN953_c0_g1~~TRINITY_DN953_c0_g1_i1.p1  ORF type:complete len:416 (+),score=63.23 TRINITY_DN953_c0_g1_i1:778-2025(+)
MLEPLIASVTKEKPDLMVCDMITVACWDVAEKFDIPMIYFSSSSLILGDPGFVFPYGMTQTYVPYQDMVVVFPQGMNYLQKLQNLFAKVIIAPFSSWYLAESRNSYRPSLGLPRVNSWTDYSHQKVSPLVMIASSIGFEYAQPLPPHYFFVGAFLKESKDQLTPELNTWLDNHENVIYVSHGTIVELKEEAIRAYIDGFAMLQGKVSVLWSLKAASWKFIPEKVPDNIRFEKFVPQQAVLKHPHVRIFVTHCGAASIAEGAVSGTPMIFAPEGADQPSNSQRGSDAGWGLVLTKPLEDGGVVHSSVLASHVNTILSDPSWQRQAELGGKQILAAGGIKKAVEVLSMAVETGWAHLVPKVSYLPWYEKMALDIYVPLLVVAWLVCKAFLSFCSCIFASCLRSGSLPTPKHQKAPLH